MYPVYFEVPPLHFSLLSLSHGNGDTFGSVALQDVSNQYVI